MQDNLNPMQLEAKRTHNAQYRWKGWLLCWLVATLITEHSQNNYASSNARSARVMAA